MSWMVRILRSDTRNPWHWVGPTPRWRNTTTNPLRPPGYETVCGERALPLAAHEQTADDAARPYCDECWRWLAEHHPDTLTDPAPDTANPE